MSIVILGLGGYIVYDKFIGTKSNEVTPDEEEQKEDEYEELDIDSSLVKNLVYPNATDIEATSSEFKNYKDITVINGRDFMMASAGLISNRIDYDYFIDGETIPRPAVLEIELEKNFKKMFGPDTTYYNGKLDNEIFICEIIRTYDAINQLYPINSECGSTSYGWGNETRLYKAEQAEEEIYTYFYVQPYFVPFEEKYDNYIFLFRRQFTVDYSKGVTPTSYTKIIDEDTAKATIQTMMDNGEVNTYKFTFKKQSDGKYYFYSGYWE